MRPQWDRRITMYVESGQLRCTAASQSEPLAENSNLPATGRVPCPMGAMWIDTQDNPGSAVGPNAMINESEYVRIEVRDGVRLTEIRASDKPSFVNHLNNKEIYANTLRIPYPYSEQNAEQFLAIATETTARLGHPVHFAVRDLGDQLIGGCGFHGLSYEHCAEIGYWLAVPYWGQGIMTDVVRSACDFAFRHWKLVRISAHVFVSNMASGRVLEKNGFVLEGLLRKYHRKDGCLIDSKVYALVE